MVWITFFEISQFESSVGWVWSVTAILGILEYFPFNKKQLSILLWETLIIIVQESSTLLIQNIEFLNRRLVKSYIQFYASGFIGRIL